MTDINKVENFDYTVYILEGLLINELDDIVDDWMYSADTSFTRGKLNAYKEALYNLTLDQKWNLSLEELRVLLLNEETN